jgi:hypothetical protein
VAKASEEIKRATTSLAIYEPDTSRVSPVLSFTTVTVSPVTRATQRAAESAFAYPRYDPWPRAV